VGVINAVKQANCRYRLIDEIFVGKPYQIQPLGIWDSSYEIRRDQKLSTAVYSFYPTRQIASFDGGMIVTDSDDAAEWYRKAKAGGVKEEVYTWDYDVEFAGYRADMTEAQAALALSQLRKIDENNDKRTAIVREYNERLGEKNSSLTIFPILVNGEESRQQFVDFAKEKGFEVSVHFRPLHWLKAYKILRYRYPFPKSDEWGKREVSLPLYPDMTKADIDTVCNAVLEWKDKEV
jgi:dTDP-4-amino-4,6-dideoxygalactose transaminase